MKRLPIFLIRLIFICLFGLIFIEAYGYSPWIDEFNRLTSWLIPAYIYCFLFGIIILIGLIIISLIYKEKINLFFKQLNCHLRNNPFTSVDLSGILLAIPLGLFSGILFRRYWFSAFGIILPLMLSFIIILSYGSMRNKIFNRHTLKLLSFISIAAFLSSLVFIMGTKLGLPRMDQEYYEWGSYYSRFYKHPFDSIEYIWEFVPYFIVLVPLVDIFVLFGKIPLKLPIFTFSKKYKANITKV